MCPARATVGCGITDGRSDRPPPVRPNAQTQIAKHCFCLDGRRLRPGLSDGVSMAAGVPPQPPTGQRTSTSHCRTSVVMSQAALPTWEILQLVAGTPIVSGSTIIPGSVLGAATHLLTTNQIPPHTHSGATSTDGAHTHGVTGATGTGQSLLGLGDAAGTNATFQTGSAGAHSHTFTTDSGTVSSGAHNNVQLTVLGTFFRKL